MKYALISGLLCAVIGFFVGTKVDISESPGQRDDSKVLNSALMPSGVVTMGSDDGHPLEGPSHLVSIKKLY